MFSRIRTSVADKDKGFTLIELLVVIIIIGILAAIAIPVFLNQRKKAHDASLKSDLKHAALMMETFYVDNQYYPGDTIVDDLRDDLPTWIDSPPTRIAFKLNSSRTAYCLFTQNGQGSRHWYYISNAGGLQAIGGCPASFTSS